MQVCRAGSIPGCTRVHSFADNVGASVPHQSFHDACHLTSGHSVHHSTFPVAQPGTLMPTMSWKKLAPPSVLLIGTVTLASDSQRCPVNESPTLHYTYILQEAKQVYVSNMRVPENMHT